MKNGIQEKLMAKRFLILLPILSYSIALLFLGGRVTVAQDDTTNIRVNVDWCS